MSASFAGDGLGSPAFYSDTSAFEADFSTAFPEGGQVPEVQDLANFNLTRLREGKQIWSPQNPEVVTVGCSKLDLDRIHDVREPGHIFLVSGRAGRISEGGVTSVEYGLGLGAPFLQVLVHSCTEQGICRGAEFQRLDQWGKTTVPLVQISETPSLDGIEPLNFFYSDGVVPDVDRIHCRNRLLKVMANAPRLRELVAEGKLLVGESYYDERSGKVYWLSFWRSKNLAAQFPRAFLTAIVEGRLDHTSNLEELHPAMKSVVGLVLGNSAFVKHFEIPVPVESVVFGCADSRVPSTILRAPFGMVEWLRNAGNVIDDPMLPGLRVALESAERHLRHKPRKFGDPEGYQRSAVLTILSHTECGAIKASLNGGDPGGVAPLVNPIRRRLGDYLRAAVDDHHFARAAVVNATAACLEVVGMDHPDARRIREMVLDRRVLLLPARFSAKTGLIQFRRPIGRAEVLSLPSMS